FLPEYRLIAIKLRTHSRILRCLPGEQKRQPAVSGRLRRSPGSGFCSEGFSQLFFRTDNGSKARGKVRSAAGTGEANIRQRPVLAGKPREVTIDRCPQCGIRPCRQREQGQIRLRRPLARRRRFFEHDESVRTAETERIDRAESRTIARTPFAALRTDEERRRGEVDLRVGIAEIEAGRDFSVSQRQRSLDQSGEPSRLFQV